MVIRDAARAHPPHNRRLEPRVERADLGVPARLDERVDGRLALVLLLDLAALLGAHEEPQAAGRRGDDHDPDNDARGDAGLVRPRGFAGGGGGGRGRGGCGLDFAGLGDDDGFSCSLDVSAGRLSGMWESYTSDGHHGRFSVRLRLRGSRGRLCCCCRGGGGGRFRFRFYVGGVVASILDIRHESIVPG